MRVNLIACVARNGVIGNAGGLVWRDQQDMKYFRNTTMGHPVVMGRKTWDSIEEQYRPLNGRRNVVISSQKGLVLEGAEVVHSYAEALSLLQAEGDIFVIGGAQIYAQALRGQVYQMYITELEEDFPGDTVFPDWLRLKEKSNLFMSNEEWRLDKEGKKFWFRIYTFLD